MKKFLVSLLALCVFVLSSLTGCSCNPASPLTFSNTFLGEANTSNFQEHLEYEVNYLENSLDYPYLNRDSELDVYIEDLSMTGSYVCDLTTVLNGSVDIPDNNIVGENGIYNASLYCLRTEFSVTATYTLKNQSAPTIKADEIISEVYFLPSGHSFAPVYSKTNAVMHLVSLSQNGLKFSDVEYEYETVYNQSNYKLSKKVILDNETIENTVDKKYGYSYKCIIDNNQLLFALRNLSTVNGENVEMPVVAPAYGKATKLGFLETASSNKEFTFDLNGQPLTEQIPVKNVSYAVSKIQSAGRTHYAVVQNGASASIKNKGLIIRYAQPLPVYGSMSNLGALEFKLLNASF